MIQTWIAEQIGTVDLYTLLLYFPTAIAYWQSTSPNSPPMMLQNLPEIETERLFLEQFHLSDLADLTALYASPTVMRYVGSGVRSAAETEESLRKTIAHWQQHGFGMWKVVEQATGAFVGRAGLIYLNGTPEIEVGYVLDQPFWGRGLAAEAAQASLRFGFETLKLERIVAIARPQNLASQRVMQKVGMTYEKDAFYYQCDVVYYAIACEQFQPGDAAYRPSNAPQP